MCTSYHLICHDKVCQLSSVTLSFRPVIYLCVRGIEFVSFYDISIGFWNCSASVVFFCSMVDQELLTLLEHLNSPPVFSGVRVTRSLDFCVVFCTSLRVLFLLFILAIVLSVLWFTHSDYPFGIFKLFLQYKWIN